MARDHGLARYKKGPDEHGTAGRGCRCTRCRGANSAWQRNRGRMIAYGRWDGLADATGTRRRLRALMRNGWSLGVLSARLGCTRQVLRTKLHDRERATAATVTAVRALYDELWDQAPPEGTKSGKRAATMARRYAQERGWPPPAAWDDDEIDDPSARPADGWERREGVRRYGVLAEEAADLLGFGEGPRQVAERLGVTQATVTVALRRAAAREIGHAA